MVYIQFSKADSDTAKSAVSMSQTAAPAAMMKNEAVSGAMMTGDKKTEWTKEEMESMEKDGKSGTMMKQETGYQAYSDSLVGSALKEGKKVAIFFHASWCPNCQALDETIKSHLSEIPNDTLILKADYDTETALKQKYGVTMQTTVVTLKSDGSLDKKILGPKSVAEILN